MGYSRKTYIECNDYLKNETSYNKLKENLLKTKFNFYNIDIINDTIPNNTKYDFIYLSNILDFLKSKNNLEYIKKVKEIILKLKISLSELGTIAVSYIYLYFDDCPLNNNANIFKSYPIIKKHFNEFQYITFPGIFTPHSKQLRNHDALIFYKNN